MNEAWTAAGFEGTISHTVVNETRVKMGLIGNQRGKTRTGAKEKSAPRMPKTATATPGKTRFVKEFLHDNPEGNVKAVNEAWTAAGFDGSISATLVNKMRAALGLTGNLSGMTKAVARRRQRPPARNWKTSERAHGCGQRATTRQEKRPHSG